MPRSHAIWVVIDTARPMPPIAAFTVKGELREWLSKQTKLALVRIRVFRYENTMINCGGKIYGDGKYVIPEELPIANVLAT